MNVMMIFRYVMKCVIKYQTRTLTDKIKPEHDTWQVHDNVKAGDKYSRPRLGREHIIVSLYKP